jgi:hypothetical protein
MGRPGAKRIAIGGGVGLLGGLAGAGACSGVFIALYHPHPGGQIGDWTFLVVAIIAFVLGAPLGLAAGVAWSFSARPKWQLASGLAVAGLIAGIVVSSVLR